MEIRKQAIVPQSGGLNSAPLFVAPAVNPAMESAIEQEGVAAKSAKQSQLRRPRPYKKPYRKVNSRDYRADIKLRESAEIVALLDSFPPLPAELELPKRREKRPNIADLWDNL